MTFSERNAFFSRNRVYHLQSNFSNNVSYIIYLQNQPPPPCPEVSGGASNCVTPFYFMTFIALQIAIVIGWAVYR